MTKRQITLDEWDEYEWVDTSVYDEDGVLFLRARHKVDPPDDGFKYVEQNRIGDAETRWVPALTFERVEGVERIEKVGKIEKEFDRLWNVEDIYFLNALGIEYEIITDLEKYIRLTAQQLAGTRKPKALIYKPRQWGIHNLHPLSFGAGFLLSSLFWLIIGIAIGVLSK